MLDVADKDNLTNKDVKRLVTQYIDLQEYRKRALNDKIVDNLAIAKAKTAECEIAQILTIHAQKDKVADWASRITGVGAVLACGVVAYLGDVKSINELYSLAGFIPRNRYNNSEYSVELKRISCRIAENFVSTADNRHDVYGHIYKYRRDFETDKNNRLEYKEQADSVLEKNNHNPASKNFKWHMQGKLSPAHINMRARRYAVKIFLQHLFSVYNEVRNGVKCNDMAVAILDKEVKVPIPHWVN